MIWAPPAQELASSPTYAVRPELRLGGRLRHFGPFWRELTDDHWVLSVITKGYRMEFATSPLYSAVRVTRLHGDGDVLRQELQELLEKDAIELVPIGQMGSGFYSTYFQVPKKDGGTRPILNLKPFNRCLLKLRFIFNR